MLYLSPKEYKYIRAKAFELHIPMSRWVSEQLFDKPDREQRINKLKKDIERYRNSKK